MKQTASTSVSFHILDEGQLTSSMPLAVLSQEYVVQARDVSYRFTLHQHPYVTALVQRLLQRSTKGLLDADTEFTTRVRLTNATATRDVFGQPLQLPANEVVYLKDGATVVLDGSNVRLVGDKVLKLADDSPLIPKPDTAVTLPVESTVRRGNGSNLKIEAASAATLVDGVPRPALYSELFDDLHYFPDPALADSPFPVRNLDFTSGGAYAVYNWELFFHVPMAIAIQLSKNQRFPEAQRWFHYCFDPTDDSDGPTPERFWKVRPFQTTDVRKIEEILVNLATGAEEDLRKSTIRSIEAWKDAPFRPHAIARFRQQAYMYKTVTAYIDNLMAWGDSLFRQDTGEAIDEALQLYVLAANILGPRPMAVPKKGNVRPQTYANLRNDLKQFGTVMRDMEPDVAFDLMPLPAADGANNDRLATLRSLGKALYFCVPSNDNLLAYWDTVADRLFKIRNSLNFQGIFRQLALFEPPIDPGMLARATAGGLDVGSIVNGLNQPLPLVRFGLLVQKASELAQEVKSLGNNLLSAMEKVDGEAMAILRAKHERTIFEMVEHVKYGQLQESIKAKEGLLQTLALAVQRYSYYELQLGKSADEIEKAVPELDELDAESLQKMKFAMEESGVGLRPISVDIAEDLGDSGGKLVSSYEALELEKLADARDLQDVAQLLHLGGQAISLLPQFGIKFHFWGLGGDAAYGGFNLGKIAQFAANVASALAEKDTYEAGKASKIGGYARREQDWAFQSNLAAGEIAQVFKQLRAAQIRVAVAELELKSHRQQMKHAEEIERFLNEDGTEKTGKVTNKALYAWMKREVKGLYSQCFQFAFDIAKKAERALQHELGNPGLSYLQFGYLAGKEGLLAGEKLYLDIKRMELAYHEQNQREYELTKHVSVLQVDPLALIQLRTTGRCTVRLPESLFDMDGPGHYFRRIKAVAVSIPCVTGPYTSVNCTLTLLKSSIRKTAVVGDEYARTSTEDARFSDNFGSIQSIVTSSGQNDSGMFETNLRDERLLPFENSGVISEWQLQLPANPSKNDPRQFDYDTISDVILHLRYTAREGGGLLRTGSLASIRELMSESLAAGSARLFSVRQEFPTEWARFLNQTPAANQRFRLTLDLRDEHFPFWAQGRLNGVTRVDVLARSRATTIEVADTADTNDVAAKKDALVKDAALGGLVAGKLTNIASALSPTGVVNLFLDTNSLSDLWIAVAWNA